MTGGRLRRDAVPVVLLLTGAASLACSNPPAVNVEPAPALTVIPFDAQFLLPECPTRWDTLSFLEGQHGSATTVVAPEGFALVEQITDVPEFHDCQKLLVGDGSSYGPLVAVFATYDLASLEVRLDRINRGERVQTRALAGALLLNLGRPYQPLGIAERFSCLYLWKRGPQWSAKIVAVGEDHTKCLAPYHPTPADLSELRVVPYLAPGFASPVHYPPVARWEWDDSTNQHYIGLKCGPRWCEVGSRTFVPSPPNVVGGTPGSAAALVRSVKGWYDEQELAIPPATASGTSSSGAGDVVPSGRRGIVFPDTTLGTHSLTDYDATWRTVAYIAIEAGLPYYKSKLNLDPVSATAPLASMNVLSYCRGSRAACGVPLVPAPGELAPECGDLDAPDHWWVRIVSASQADTMYRCVTRRGHAGQLGGRTIPATARWRWLLDDETIWKECVEGCCQVESRGKALSDF